MRFFLDNCIIPRLAPALRILAEKQQFDIKHLPKSSQIGASRIQTGFGPRWAEQSFWKLASSLVWWWPHIVLEAQHAIPGSVYLMQLGAKEMQKIYTPL